MKVVFQISIIMHEIWIGTENYQIMTFFVYIVTCTHPKHSLAIKPNIYYTHLPNGIKKIQNLVVV
jgi:hypothetical protein